MKPEKTADLRSIASLLEDEDEGVAVSAIAELLNRESELGDLLGELQESSNPLMRRRVQQLNSALTLIRRRRYMSVLLHQKQFSFSNALILMHLQWFDNDSITMVQDKYNSLLCELSRFPNTTLAGLGSAFAALGITAVAETTLKIENYCIGTMIDERSGSSALWCGLICSLLPEHVKARVILLHDTFAVLDGENTLLIPEKNWYLDTLTESGHVKMIPQRVLLRYAMSNLFSAAVNSDSFRYILTILQAITGNETDEPLTALPYPYNPDITDLEAPDQPQTF